MMMSAIAALRVFYQPVMGSHWCRRTLATASLQMGFVGSAVRFHWTSLTTNSVLTRISLQASLKRALKHTVGSSGHPRAAAPREPEMDTFVALTYSLGAWR